MAKKDPLASELRKQWCNCCDEFGTMVHEEVKNNPRYNQTKMWWKNESPPSTS
tara:strand:+ start:472 stop:630 length:159 start_codon:yes stop_codon:yes gene_type:complete